MKKSSMLLMALAVASTSAFAQKVPKVGVVIYKFDDTFMSYVRGKIESEAKAAGVKISVQDGQGDQAKVNDITDLFMSQGYNSLALNMVEPTSANVIIQKVSAKKLPVVFFNREPDAGDMSKYPLAYYVGAKAQASGTMEGEIVVDYWKANPAADKNKDGKLQYVMLIGDPANTDAKYRTEYSVKAVKAAGIKVESLAEDTAMWQRGEAVLVDDSGETQVVPGDVLTFPAGQENGHHLQNRSDAPCTFIAIGAGPRAEDKGVYPDIDMVFDAAGYARRDGTRYASSRVP